MFIQDKGILWLLRDKTTINQVISINC